MTVQAMTYSELELPGFHHLTMVQDGRLLSPARPLIPYNDGSQPQASQIDSERHSLIRGSDELFLGQHLLSSNDAHSLNLFSAIPHLTCGI